MEALYLTNLWNLLLGMSWPWINHIYRKANKCADVLAKLGANLNYAFITFDHPSDMVENLLTLDKVSNVCNKLISISDLSNILTFLTKIIWKLHEILIFFFMWVKQHKIFYTFLWVISRWQPNYHLKINNFCRKIVTIFLKKYSC